MGWYESKTGNHQGLVIDEQTGANIAVVYDKKDAPLIASAPDMLEALENLLFCAGSELEKTGSQVQRAAIAQANSAIRKAKGGDQ